VIAVRLLLPYSEFLFEGIPLSEISIMPSVRRVNGRRRKHQPRICADDADRNSFSARHLYSTGGHTGISMFPKLETWRTSSCLEIQISNKSALSTISAVAS
jgi:hypothetical protein